MRILYDAGFSPKNMIQTFIFPQIKISRRMRVEPYSNYVTIISIIASVYLRNRMERDSGWSEKLCPFFQFQDESHAWVEMAIPSGNSAKRKRKKFTRKHLDETMLMIRTHNSSPIIRLINGKYTKLRSRLQSFDRSVASHSFSYLVTRFHARIISSQIIPIRFTNRRHYVIER